MHCVIAGTHVASEAIGAIGATVRSAQWVIIHKPQSHRRHDCAIDAMRCDGMRSDAMRCDALGAIARGMMVILVA